MGFFGKKIGKLRPSSDLDKHCFRCGKKIKGNGFTKAQGRYCCSKCCSQKGKGREVCEFC